MVTKVQKVKGLAYGPLKREQAFYFAATRGETQDAVLAETKTGWFVGFYWPEEALAIFHSVEARRHVRLAALMPAKRKAKR